MPNTGQGGELSGDGTHKSGADGPQIPLPEQYKESIQTLMQEQVQKMVADQVESLQTRMKKEVQSLEGRLTEQDEKFRKMMPIATEEAEELVGTLIRVLNPYAHIMHYPPGNPQPPFLEQKPEQYVEELKSRLDAFRDRAGNKLDQFQFEVDNRYGSQNSGEYLSWEFKREPQIIKKAVKIQFRHPAEDGGWIIDHLLIGFAGSDGP